MKKLTRAEEREYIKGIIEGKYPFLGYGSTRATYQLDENRVIKVTMDKKYIGQHETEIELFDLEGSEFLAKIFEYGEQVIIAEKVLVADGEVWDDFSYFWERYCGRTMPIATKDGRRKIGGIVLIGPILLEKLDNNINPFDEYDLVSEFLTSHDINDDGGQFGYTKNGKLVAYDYGLSFNQNSSKEMIGSLYSNFFGIEEKYFDTIYKSLLEDAA